MTTVWRSLLWKEWREQRWILLGILAIAALVPAPLAWRDTDNYRVGLTMMGALFVPLASLFVGAWIAAGEQSRRTIDFLRALPVPMSTPARAKLLCAAGVVLTPGLMALVIGSIWGWQHRADLTAHDFGDGAVILTMMSLLPFSIMLWAAAFGANFRDEIRAGVVALAGISLCWSILALVGLVVTPHNADWPTWLRIGAAFVPGSPIMGPTFIPNQLGAPLAVFSTLSVVAHIAVVATFARRFGRGSRPIQNSAVAAKPVAAQQRWLAAPRTSPRASIAWKQWRETASLAGVGLVAILGITAILAVIIARMETTAVGRSIMGAAFGTWVMLGFAVAIVCGISLLHEDLRPDLYAFWRSRPIQLNLWFAIKLITGLLTTTAFLLAAPAVFLLIFTLTGAQSWAENDAAPVAVWCGAILAFHACGFLVALATTAVFRTATAAALVTVLVAVVAGYVADKLGLDPNTDLPLLVGAVALAGAAAVGVAWFAVKKDWRIG